jgi:hypothetical protein
MIFYKKDIVPILRKNKIFIPTMEKFVKGYGDEQKLI